MFIRLISAFCFIITIIPFTANAANPAVLFVFDGSGSMWGQVEGKTKIELAKQAMTGLVKGFPEGTDMGLIAYGHRRDGDCNDIETLAPAGSSKEAILKAVNSINPKGKTPLTKAIQFAAGQLKNRDAPASIVVISDGMESCNADPCATAKAVRKAGVNLKLHVIGFDVKKDEAEQLQCIAKNGGGKYFAAGNAGELAKSFAAVRKEVVEKKPVPKVIFRDDFNEDFLSEDWDVQNPDAEAMVLDEGKLILMAREASLDKGNVPNLIILNKAISAAHYTATIKLHGDFEEKYVRSAHAGLLLYADPQNFLEVWVRNSGTGLVPVKSNSFTSVNTILASYQKNSGGKISKSATEVPIAWQWPKNQTASVSFDVWMRIEKNKYKYTAYVSRDGEKWQSLGTIPLLGKKMKPALFASHQHYVSDTMVGFDWFEISELVKEKSGASDKQSHP